MMLTRRNLSVVALVSLVSFAGCAPHDKKEAPPTAPTSTEAAPASVGVTTPAAAKEVSTSAVAPAVVTADHPVSTLPSAPATKSRGVDAAGLNVKRLVVARGIEGREPKEPGVAFWKGDFDKLYAFVELQNPEKTDAHVVVTFVPPGGKAAKGNVSLAVGASPRWRTWASSRAIDEKGTWAAVVSTEDGREIGRQSFDVL